MGRKAPRKRLARRVMACPTGVPPSTRTFLGAPPTPSFGVSEAKSQTPGAENAPRERDGLFDIVRWVERDAVLILMSAHRRAAHFKKSQAAPRTRSTNLWLWETIAGCDPLFADCYLQWNPQLQRVESSATSRWPAQDA